MPMMRRLMVAVRCPRRCSTRPSRYVQFRSSVIREADVARVPGIAVDSRVGPITSTGSPCLIAAAADSCGVVIVGWVVVVGPDHLPEQALELGAVVPLSSTGFQLKRCQHRCRSGEGKNDGHMWGYAA